MEPEEVISEPGQQCDRIPWHFQRCLEGRATQITEEMKLAAAEALAHLVSDEELNDEFIMPEAFDPRVAEVVSQAVNPIS